jgi:hypothetical protein
MEVEQYISEEGYRVTISLDDWADDPRNWDNVGTMACWHGRYVLGDEQPEISPEEYLADLPEGIITLPLYLYDHSGITMNTTGFSCHWDSGKVGFIYVTPETLAKEFIRGVPDDETVREHLVGEVKTYDNYLTGEVYRVEVESGIVCSHGDTHWEMMDGCSGFYGEQGIEEIRSQWPKAQATVDA